jgi:hypothetical protein
MKNILIIGSGTTAANNKIGKYIDNYFDIVVRFNGYQLGLGKYDEYVGIKTNIVIGNSSMVSHKYFLEYPNIYLNNTEFYLKASFMSRYKKIKKLLNNNGYNKVFILKQYSITTEKNKIYSMANFKNASLGLRSIFLIKYMFPQDNISLLGFDRLHKKMSNKNMNHYYGKNLQINKKHNMKKETSIIKDLINERIINKFI